MGTEKIAVKVISRMMEKDLFSKWLGIELLEAGEGFCRTKMLIREEMINGLGIIHGGVAFSMADSTFAFACNSRNNLSVALDTSINFVKPVNAGDTLFAESREIHNGKSTGLYHITLTNQSGHTVAVFKGTCFRTNRKIID